MRKSSSYIAAVLLAAASSYAGAAEVAKYQRQRTPDDISARQRKRQAKLARRAKRHAGKAKGDFDASN